MSSKTEERRRTRGFSISHSVDMEMEMEAPMNLKAVKPADRSKVKAALAKAAFGG